MEQNSIVTNRNTKDNAAKLLFDDPILCAEFLRDYVGIGEIPSTLQQTILSEKDLNQPKAWLKLAVKAENLSEFKKNAGLG